MMANFPFDWFLMQISQRSRCGIKTEKSPSREIFLWTNCQKCTGFFTSSKNLRPFEMLSKINESNIPYKPRKCPVSVFSLNIPHLTVACQHHPAKCRYLACFLWISSTCLRVIIKRKSVTTKSASLHCESVETPYSVKSTSLMSLLRRRYYRLFYFLNMLKNKELLKT